MIRHSNRIDDHQAISRFNAGVLPFNLRWTVIGTVSTTCTYLIVLTSLEGRISTAHQGYAHLLRCCSVQSP